MEIQVFGRKESVEANPGRWAETGKARWVFVGRIGQVGRVSRVGLAGRVGLLAGASPTRLTRATRPTRSTRPTRPTPSVRPPSERHDEEENQRDQQHVDDERLDEDETQNQVAANLSGGARVPRDAFHGSAEALGLTERTEGRGEGQRKTAGDDRPLGDHIPGGRRRGSRRLL